MTLTKQYSLVLFICMVASFAAADVLFQTVPFYQGYEGYHTFRIPALLVAPNGTLLAFADGRVNSGSDSGDVDMTLRRSFDGGQTWQPLQVIWDDGENTCGGAAPVVDQTTGRIWLFIFHALGQDTQGEITSGTSDGVVTYWTSYSDDNGATWSTPVNRYDEVQSSDRPWDQFGAGCGIQIKNGTHAGRLVIPAFGRNIYSDDHGATWHQGGALPSGGGEATVVEVGSAGTLMRNDRATGSGGYVSYNRRLISYSYNQGSTWTAYRVQDDLVCPICNASMLRATDPDGEVLMLFSNPAATTRTKMTVKTSRNNGYSWPAAKLIYARDAAYSSLCQLPDGSIGLFYENGDGSAYNRMTFAKFSYEWLTDSSLFLWDFEEYAPSEQITTSDTVEDIRGYTLDGHPEQTFSVTQVSDSRYGGTSAVSFTGSGGGIKISDEDAKDIIDFDAAQNFCIRVVFRTGAHGSGGSTGSGVIIAKDVSADTPAWWLRVQDGKLRFFVHDGTVSSSVYSLVDVNDDVWHEVIAYHSADEGVIGIIIDGVASGQKTYTTTASYDNDGDVSVGCYNDGGKGFIGEIDRIQVYRDSYQNLITVFEGDLNGDSRVDLDDLVILITNWQAEG